MVIISYLNIKNISRDVKVHQNYCKTTCPKIDTSYSTFKRGPSLDASKKKKKLSNDEQMVAFRSPEV
ncbi:CRE_collapsed_G0000820.mRNA.1.CDS.1 [Saccharomyces cerevisiae]|nr:AMP_1a_G0000160.mRNA.1.CDS.1 [Saccharomyces cerevisiae]CAI4237762.1 BDH_1b_G0000040.mRNA.1.CDS.1 [Saccharomyces cerevisiae]CAI4240002.1 BDC_1c_G0000860.mRNA.1.CDS.1 [Saccharomyces cerevisiae]CAI4240660.1 AMP_1a_G0001030.mRNA.1.CDS.1 [Saccharomyces cerevisiae]CAI4242493.1 BDF_1d_G0000830.mRNA.1.CDS.1 [Saccharomyces cerevisiae]